jgi:DNA-binding response OmpR family regulator
MWLQERDCKDKIAHITALLGDAIQKARPIALQIDSEKSVAHRQEIAETIADINRSMRVVEGYIRNIRRKFSDHLATIFSEPIE